MDTFFEKRKNQKMPKYGQNAQVWTVSDKNGCPHLGTGTVRYESYIRDMFGNFEYTQNKSLATR